MPRIRTVKPDFFRDEKLQDLEAAHPELKPMLVFEGLWTVSDKVGRFEWRPRSLKLDILPFLDFDLNASLVLLREAGMLSRYVVNGKEYGLVLNFCKHQRINGKESQEPAKFPDPSLGTTREAIEKQPRSQEGKGRERKGNGKELILGVFNRSEDQEVLRKIAEERLSKIYKEYPRKVGKGHAFKAIATALTRLLKGEESPGELFHSLDDAAVFLMQRTQLFARSPAGQAGEYTPHPATWYNAKRYLDDESEWSKRGQGTEPSKAKQRFTDNCAAVSEGLSNYFRGMADSGSPSDGIRTDADGTRKALGAKALPRAAGSH